VEIEVVVGEGKKKEKSEEDIGDGIMIVAD